MRDGGDGSLDAIFGASHEPESRPGDFRHDLNMLDAERYRDFRIIGSGGMGGCNVALHLVYHVREQQFDTWRGTTPSGPRQNP